MTTFQKRQNETRSASVSPIAVQKYLKGVRYPASRDDLLKAAHGNGAADDVVGFLNNVPDVTFRSPKEIMRHFNGRMQAAS